MRQLSNLLPRITIRNETPPTIKGGGNVPTCAAHTMTKQTSPLRSYLNHRSPTQSHGDNSFRYSRLADHFTNYPSSSPVPVCLTNTGETSGVPELQTRGNAAIKMENSQRARPRPAGPLHLGGARMRLKPTVEKRGTREDWSRWILLVSCGFCYLSIKRDSEERIG